MKILYIIIFFNFYSIDITYKIIQKYKNIHIQKYVHKYENIIFFRRNSFLLSLPRMLIYPTKEETDDIFSPQSSPENEQGMIRRGGVEMYPLDVEDSSNRTPTLPSQEFRPKQSLGQNFISDPNYVKKITDAMESDNINRVVETGPGIGALTGVLYEKYPKMSAIEIDDRAIAILRRKFPDLTLYHQNVLDVDWTKLSMYVGGRLAVFGNLPFYITSQFS
eukprot:GHVL01040754.1.p1 GENE.GHVL01040754.1~~GHVL01040754.1.p1  ORF type:complete len:220 (-),score=32.96 GHVL01040754.1:911-1570(-)